MYQIASHHDQWAIMDEQQRPVFLGSLGQCEDWLDFQENKQRLSQASVPWWRRWWESLRSHSPAPDRVEHLPSPHSRLAS